MTTESLLAALSHTDTQIQIEAVEASIALVHRLIEAMVQALEDSPNRFLVAERLHQVGASAIPYLENRHERTTNREVKVLCAIVLLQLGSRSGAETLLQGVSKDSEYAGLCARHLVASNIDGLKEPIAERLRTCSLDEVDLILDLLDSLVRIKEEIPPDFMQRLLKVQIPWQIRTWWSQQLLNGTIAIPLE